MIWIKTYTLHSEYSKTCLKRPLKIPKIGFQDRLLLNAGQKNCRMLQESILQYFRPSLELLFVVKTFVLSVFEWPFKTGFTVNIITLRSKSQL